MLISSIRIGGFDGKRNDGPNGIDAMEFRIDFDWILLGFGFGFVVYLFID